MASIFAFKSRECDGVQFVGALTTDPTKPDSKKHEIIVPSEREFIATFRILAYSETCHVTAAFTPGQGERYTVLFDRTSTQCIARVTRWNEVRMAEEVPPTLSVASPKCTY